MTAQCSRCHAPCSSTDLDCPRCGTALPRPAAAPVGRAVILGPVAPAPAATVAATGTAPVRLPAPPRARRRRFLRTTGPLVSGTVTGRIEDDRHVADRRRTGAVIITVVAVLGVLGLAVAGGLGSSSQTLVLLLALGGVLVVARGASVALRIAVGEGAVGAYELRRRTFELTETSGTRHTCHLDGEPVGDPPRRGDVVDVYGRAGRDGSVHVREAVRLVDGTVIGARPAPAAVAGRIADVAAVLVVLTCVIAGVALLVAS